MKKCKKGGDMDNITTYNYLIEAQDALVKYWGEDGKKVIGQCFKERKFDGDVSAFLKFCTACGGNWGGMFLSGIRTLYPEVYALIPNGMGQSAFACITYVLLLLGVKTWE